MDSVVLMGHMLEDTKGTYTHLYGRDIPGAFNSSRREKMGIILKRKGNWELGLTTSCRNEV